MPLTMPRLPSLMLSVLAFSTYIPSALGLSYDQLTYSSVPDRAFVGSFAGPLYTAGVATPACSALVSPGYGTNTYTVMPNVTYPSSACTNLAAVPFADYSYLGVLLKCTSAGEGYLFNYPPNVTGAPPTVGGQYYCTKFKNYSNVTEMTFTQGYSDNVQCPETFSSESEIVSNPGSNAGFVKYYALGGSAFPDC